MISATFAERKEPRMPGRTPALPNTKIQPQHMEKKENVNRRNDFVFQTMGKLERQWTGHPTMFKLEICWIARPDAKL
jgi:hypothetical protein